MSEHSILFKLFYIWNNLGLSEPMVEFSDVYSFGVTILVMIFGMETSIDLLTQPKISDRESLYDLRKKLAIFFN